MRTQLLIIATAAAIVTGCASTDAPGTITGQATNGSEPSGAYELVDISGTGRPSGAAQITLTFGPGTLAADSGCNTMTGRAGLDGDRLTVTDPRTTDLPCPEEFVAVQEWVAAFFADRPTVALDGGGLTLTTARATMRLRSTGTPSPDTQQPSDAPRTG
ncbi:META domain-containing protein [Catenuloplanes sp. NPDC051500]|uniref:META domain-containing protein n=1 Tax=Catenuloplanes sp. NPDC051500 TaxID=3363959 RepID=UPI0037A324AF